MNLCRHRRQIYSLLPLTRLGHPSTLEIGDRKLDIKNCGTLKGIRTPVARMKTWYPRPLDDEGTGEILQWSGCPDLNRGPPAPKAGALPNCATARSRVIVYLKAEKRSINLYILSLY